jgi:hypothetical protein
MRNQDRGRADDLQGEQCRCDVDTGQRLQKHDTDTHTLNTVEDAQPKPKSNREVWPSCTSPGQVRANARSGPEGLAPSRESKASTEHGQCPGVCAAEVVE